VWSYKLNVFTLAFNILAIVFAKSSNVIGFGGLLASILGTPEGAETLFYFLVVHLDKVNTFFSFARKVI
jgi:hypothetical protein